MTISDRRLERVWRRKFEPVAGSVETWADVTHDETGSSWVAADPESPLVFARDRARLGEDLAAAWRSAGREILLPLAPEMHRLSERVTPDAGDDSRQVSSTVYEMQ